MAERVGFEPTVPLPAHVLSRHADSAALAPLRSALDMERKNLNTGSYEQQVKKISWYADDKPL